MTPPVVDAILEIRHHIQMDKLALESTELASFRAAISMMEDHLYIIDKKLTELTTEEN